MSTTTELELAGIRAWESDDADCVVWGTHDPALAVKAWEESMERDMGFSRDDDDWVTSKTEPNDWANAAKWWGDRGLLETEGRWSDDIGGISKVPVDGYVPYMVVVR